MTMNLKYNTFPPFGAMKSIGIPLVQNARKTGAFRDLSG
jgi:hypothetical protein